MPYRIIAFLESAIGAIGKLIAFLLLWFAPISDYIHLVIVLIFIDLITGSYASVKEGQRFSASKMRNTVEKFLFYSLAIISAFVLQKIVNDGLEMPRMVALYIGATELKSIYENISRITKTDLVGQIWNVLKMKINEYLKKDSNVDTTS